MRAYVGLVIFWFGMDVVFSLVGLATGGRPAQGPASLAISLAAVLFMLVLGIAVFVADTERDASKKEDE